MAGKWFTQEQCDRAKRLREAGYSYQEIADRMGVYKGRIGKLARRNFQRHTFGDTTRPADIAFVSAEMTFNQMKAHYHVGAPILSMWLKEAGIALPDRRYRHPKRPVPDDFAQVAPTLTHREVQRHYRATGATILRWKLETGVATPRHDRNQKLRHAQHRRPGWVERYVAEQRNSSISQGA